MIDTSAMQEMELVGRSHHVGSPRFHPLVGCTLLTCTRLLFRTATNDLTGGMRRGKGAMVIARTASGAHFRAVSSSRCTLRGAPDGAVGTYE